MNYEIIGNFIAEKRKEKNLTQKQLASKIGVTDKAVSKWERGKGCPDVSILEILAKELNTSILEILKGRIIENEIIKITEANDYIVETVNYSKEQNKDKIKKLIEKIISAIIIFIVTLLILLNINHIIYLNQKHSFDFNNDYIINMKTNIDKLEKNIKIIKRNQGKYSTEEYNQIISTTDILLQSSKSIPVLNYKGVKQLSLNDLYVLDQISYTTVDVINTYQILEKYKPSIQTYRNLFTDTFAAKALLGDKVLSEPLKQYKYQEILNIKDDSLLLSNINDIQGRIYNYGYILNSYLYLTQNIIEVGGINE